MESPSLSPPVIIRPGVPLQASKWLKHQILIDIDEMRELFTALGEFFLYQTSGIISEEKGSISHGEFLRCYEGYIDAIKEGHLPEEALYRHMFSSVMTVTPDCLYAISIGDNRQLIRVAKPVIQLQHHRMDYSSIDGKFRSMVLGSESILWGIQFSYPQIFQNPDTGEVEPIKDSTAFPNTSLYRTLQLWIRHHTVATPFLIEGHKKVNIPVRIGKSCFSWINRHLQLAKKGLRVNDL